MLEPRPVSMLLLIVALPLAAQESAAPRVVATVDGVAIYDADVDRQLDRTLKQREADPVARQALRAAALDQLVRRRLIVAYLDKNKRGATRQDLDQAVARASAQLQQQGSSLAEFLKKSSLDEERFRQTLAWQLGWQRYLQQWLSDENLEKYFRDHRRDFDGTQLRVAHILWKVEPRDDDTVRTRALDQAAKVRGEILSGKLTFADAAKKHSAAPTGATGGDIGLIGRNEPMPEPFSKAAFALEVGGVSEPVVSAIGVHLIQCQEVKPGTKTWKDVRGPLESAVTRFLFDWVSDQQRPASKIEYRR